MIRMDHESRKRLGLTYVLGLLSPLTPYGAERARSPRFYTPSEREALEREWDNVQAAMGVLTRDPNACERLKHLLMQVRDIRGTLRRCRDTVLTEVELFEVKRFLLQLALIAPLFAAMGGSFRGIAFTEEAEALALLDPEGKRASGFAVGGPAAGALEAIRDEKRQVEMDLRKMPESKPREALLQARRRLAAQEEEENLKARALLTEGLRPYAEALLQNAEMLGALDFALQRAELARARGACRPRAGDSLRFVEMEHPEVADSLAGRGLAFMRISMEAPRGVTVVTGANMGGKSVALRALALNALLCQAGFFAFAKEAVLPLFDAVEVAGDGFSEAGEGLSSFGWEVRRLQGILEAITGVAFCLLVLDEPARGTNPREGAALARALVKRLAGMGAVTVMSTHFDGIARDAQAHYQAAGLTCMPKECAGEDQLAFLARHMDYGLRRVDSEAETPREALAICRLLGLDPEVMEEMERGLGEIREW